MSSIARVLDRGLKGVYLEGVLGQVKPVQVELHLRMEFDWRWPNLLPFKVRLLRCSDIYG